MLKLHFLSLILTFLMGVGLAVFVWINNPRQGINVKYALYTLSIALWAAGQAFAMSMVDKQLSLWLWTWSYVPVILMPVLFVDVVVTLMSRDEAKKKKKLQWMLYAAAVVLIVLNFNGVFLKGVEPRFYFVNYKLPTTAYYVFIVVWVGCIIYGLKMLLGIYRNAAPTDKRRYGYFLFSMTGAYVGGMANFLPTFGIYVPFLVPLGTFAVPIYMSLTGYAIIAHGLMDVKIIIRKTAVYSGILAMMSVMYLALIFVTHSIVIGQTSLSEHLYLNLAILLIVGVCYKPIEIVSQKFIDRYFFKGSIAEISAQNEKLEEELQRRERLKSVGILAAGMAHEIKNPMVTISTFLEYLPQKYDEKEFREKFIYLMTREVDRIRKIVDGLLDFSKPNEPQMERYNANELLKETAELLRGEFIKHNVKIEYRLAETAHAFIDPRQIKQVFLNVLMNAVDAIKEKKEGVILLTTSKKDEQFLSVSVRDTGCGIDKDKLKHIFDPFSTTKENGTGLGLAIVHSIIEKHHGKIFLNSQKGVGTEVVMLLQRHD